ncbi:MFS transporter [Staphylococcus gallinarum]|uniref:Major facilitator family transporter n=2 Tax=Staphylococcus gallinarum TaxID=1293 RepID=A0A0D0RLT0_STAGA|nr:MFS transporter [Staphylococcus gallinarum]KIR10897.1 transporter [Staphylococcus gallinarum]RTX80307.1 MFS transporter [Staphylococcus gallinarum]SUQ38598.1 major facilitator family transporter [Staphylococcus gallinarum]
MNMLIDKLGLKNKKDLIGFFSVLTTGQIIYSAFEAFKGTFYNLLLEVLNISNSELGVIFSLIGISVFFYIPGGWVNNRFSIKSILIFGLIVRFITMTFVITCSPSFSILKIIAIIWGVVDAFFWPAVLNGVTLFTKENKRAIGFGLLESVRRAEEMLMNLLIVAIMTIFSGIAIFKGSMLTYNLLILPLIILIIKFVPKNGISTEKENNNINKSKEALRGIFFVFSKPKIWLAAISALTIYWSYIILIYSVPYLQNLYDLSTSQTALFGIFNTGLMGVLMGIIAGIIANFVFKSSSKMIAVALFISSVILTIIVFFKIPMVLSFMLLILFSVTTFLSKSVILAPIAELKIPEKYMGSAMSIGSFVAYAPIFWVYTMNGAFLDLYSSNKIIAYELIFKIGIGVSILGCLSSMLLTIINKRTS